MAEEIPKEKQARQIQVVVEKTGKILRIWDKAATLKSWWEPSLPLDGTHYGWSLERLRDTPQRDFGMIDGYDVWLCRFSGKGPVAGTEKLFTAGSLGRKFVDQLNANN